MKKETEVDKGLFKRISSAKKTSKIAIPERVLEVNKHQHNADFVASQKRTSNTKGKKSELALDWQRFSDTDSHSVDQSKAKSDSDPSSNPSARIKSKIDTLSPAQLAQLEAHKLAQKKGARPTPMVSADSPHDPAKTKVKIDGIRPTSAPETGPGVAHVEGSNPAEAGQADLGEHISTGAGQADLGEHISTGAGQADLGEHLPTGAGQADLGEHIPTEAGQADMGHHLDGRAGFAALEGEQPAGVGQADMGHHLDGRSGFAALDGQQPADVAPVDMGHHLGDSAGFAHLSGQGAVETDVSPTSMDSAQALEEAPLADMKDTETNGESTESALSGRLAEKMSKIRAKTDDISSESDFLDKHQDKP